MEQHTAIEDLQAKIDALNQEAWSIRVSDSAQTFLLSSEAAALAKRCGYQKGLAEALRTKRLCTDPNVEAQRGQKPS
jgi:hypothetical protein